MDTKKSDESAKRLTSSKEFPLLSVKTDYINMFYEDCISNFSFLDVDENQIKTIDENQIKTIDETQIKTTDTTQIKNNDDDEGKYY